MPLRADPKWLLTPAQGQDHLSALENDGPGEIQEGHGHHGAVISTEDDEYALAFVENARF